MVPGTLLELGQVHAGMLDVQARLGLGDQWATLGPAEAVAIGHYDSPQDLQRGSNAEMMARLKSRISSATLFSTVVWAPEHFTYLEARRSSTSDPWKVFYQDSLPAQSAASHATAGRVARAVGILPVDQPLKHSRPGSQADSWSCGLWALQLMESRARIHRGEPVSPPATLHQISERLSDWITRLSNKYSVPVQSTRKAKAAAKAAANKAAASKTAPTSLDEALARAISCSKCRKTQLGQKGCQSCMGEFFFHVRTSSHPAAPPPSLTTPHHTHTHTLPHPTTTPTTHTLHLPSPHPTTP